MTVMSRIMIYYYQNSNPFLILGAVDWLLDRLDNGKSQEQKEIVQFKVTCVRWTQSIVYIELNNTRMKLIAKCEVYNSTISFANVYSMFVSIMYTFYNCPWFLFEN